MRPLIPEIETALRAENRFSLERVSQKLMSAMVSALGARGIHVRVYAVRPHGNWGELHGLYEPGEGRAPARISVWMRTAQRRRIVAFRTYLRTLLHELCHHLDYELLRLADSFHTEGFYKRESSLFHQLMAEDDDVSVA